MIELRFHQDLYDGFAVDEAAKIYGPYGSLVLGREPDGYVVQVTAAAGPDSVDERTLAAELSNYALGLTIEKLRAGENAGHVGGDPQTPGPAGADASAAVEAP